MTEEGYIAFRTDLLPALIVEFSGAVDDEIFGQYLDTMTAFTRKREPMALVVHADGLKHITPRQAARHQEWWDLNERVLRTYTAGIALVSSAGMRIVLKTQLAKRQIDIPVLITGSEEEALRWAGERLRAV